ncbi:MAG: PH domain-containing protein [Prosthecobacter sp.]|nr:PH domain-containing protein [Prosthecobacter sp.]
MLTDDSPATPNSAETSLWIGHTSQWVHFWFYFFCVLIFAGICVAATLFALPTGGLSYAFLVIPVGMWICRWWFTKTTTYELTTQRLKITSGILNRRLEELELYRVKDYSMDQPLFLRMLGLGTLSMVTSDASTPTVTIKAIPGVTEVREKLRTAVQAERDRKRVRELDVDNASDIAPA